MSSERPEHEGTGTRRRRSPLAVASVAAAVLLAGGGGAYVAATASGGGTDSGAPAGDGSTPPPLALDGYTDGGAPGIAPGEPDPHGTLYRAQGELPEGPGSAAVHRTRGEVTAEEVTRLARALGVRGVPKLSGGAWQAGPAAGDGAGPSLQVTRKGAWTFTRYASGMCEGTTRCAGTSPGGEGAAVSEQTAKQAAAPVLKALGQDDAKVDARQLMGAVRVVNADPRIGGLPTYGWSTGIQVGTDGRVVGGSGQLKKPVKGDTYPVISASRSLELLNRSGGGDGRVGVGGCASAVPLEDRERKANPCDTASTHPASRPVATVESATFGLAVHFAEGGQTLVPSWLLAVTPQGAENGFTVTYPAVDPKYLTAPDTPSAGTGEEPSPRPSTPDVQDEPGDGGTRTVRAESYSADGRSLTLHFWGGVCSDYSASARESGDRVTVSVTEKRQKPGKVCILIAKELTETVTLDEPLGDRKVVEEDGRAVPRRG